MAKSITDIVNDAFGGLAEQETNALAKLDAVADDLAQLPDDQFALAMAGLLQATADKKAGATVVGIIKQVVPALLALL
jgi:hypothetical protein